MNANEAKQSKCQVGKRDRTTRNELSDVVGIASMDRIHRREECTTLKAKSCSGH